MRTIKIIITALICFVLLATPVYAEESIEVDYKQQYKELIDESGANGLFALTPDDAKDLLSENNINSIEADKLINMNFFDFIKSAWDSIKDTASKPLSILLSGIGIILLCALINSMKSSFNNASYEKVFSVVSVISMATAIIIPIAQIINKTALLIKQMSDFMLSFVPVYVGILTASGRPVSALSYNTSLIGVVQVISRIASGVLVPLLAIYLAFCLIGATSSHIKIEGITKTVKTTVITTLSFMLTIFVGILSVQGMVASSTETVTMKAAKFGINTFLPVVGNAISEALSSVQGCMGVIKSTVGGFGIVVIISAFLPSVITILLMQFSLSITSGISEMLDTPKITALIKSASSVLSLILGILLVFFVMLTVSITIMLTIGTASL